MNTTWYEWAWGAAAGGRELLEDRFGTLPVLVQDACSNLRLEALGVETNASCYARFGLGWTR